MYKIIFSANAKRYLLAAKEKDINFFSKYKFSISLLAREPHIGSEQIGDLEGLYCWGMKYEGVTYEYAYKIFRQNDCVVIMLIGTREEMYMQIEENYSSRI